MPLLVLIPLLAAGGFVTYKASDAIGDVAKIAVYGGAAFFAFKIAKSQGLLK
jgi:hypothetical protein